MQEAMEAFWERGYAGTSVNDLLSEMKLNRGSLYDTFGDKHSLFLSALEKYDQLMSGVVKSILDAGPTPRAALRTWMQTVATACSGEGGRKGCLMLKTGMELASQDPQVASRVTAIMKRHEQLIARTIEEGQRQGEISAALDPATAAIGLLTAISGLKMFGITAPSPERMRELVDLMMKVLD